MSFFSIIIPSYNVQDYIRICLDSILAQTYQDFEVIIVDDESSDQSYNIASEYSAKYNNVIVDRIAHVAVGEVRNIAISKANGEYIVFIDADDSIEPDMLKRIHDCLMDNHADICYLPNHYVDNIDSRIEHSLIPGFKEDMFFNKREDYFSYIVDNNGSIPSSMWTGVCSKAVIDRYNITMDPKFIWSQDTDYMYKVLDKADTVSICGYRGYVWNRKNIGSATRNVSAVKVISRLSVYKKWYDAFNEGRFGDISAKNRDYLMTCLLRNYCDVIFEYTFMKDKNDRIQVADKLLSDGIWNKDKTLVPKEYYRYGLKNGRLIYKIKHYGKVIVDQIRKV